MTIREIQRKIRDLLHEHTKLLSPGAALILNMLAGELAIFREDITIERLEAVRESVAIVCGYIECTAEYDPLHDSLDAIDSVIREWIDDQQPAPSVTIVARITVPAGFRSCAGVAGFSGVAGISGLLHCIRGGHVDGSIDVTVEEG